MALVYEYQWLSREVGRNDPWSFVYDDYTHRSYWPDEEAVRQLGLSGNYEFMRVEDTKRVRYDNNWS